MTGRAAERGAGRVAGPARLDVGDPMRALAALSVLLFHVTIGAAVASGEPDAYLGSDTFGVAQGPLLTLDVGLHVFFALSGYLIARPFGAWLAGRARRPDVRRYAVRRALRVFPALWVAVAVAVLVDVAAGGGVDLRNAVSLATLTHTWLDTRAAAGELPQAWTLAAEVLFYACVPVAAGLVALAARRATPRVRVAVAVGAVAAGAAASLGFHLASSDPAQFQAPPALLFPFAGGAVMALLEPGLAARAPGSRTAARAGRLLLGAAALAGLWLLLDRPVGDARTVVAAAGASCFVAAAVLRAWRGVAPWRVLDRPVLHHLGRGSFGIYLLQTAAIDAVVAAAPSLTGWTLLAVLLLVAGPLTVLGGWASWRLVERPALLLAARLTGTRPGVEERLPGDAPLRRRSARGSP